MRDGMYAYNKERTVTINADPTETDQSGAEDTDINVIVARHAQHGTLPVMQGKGFSGDFSELPNGLRDAIDSARLIGLHQSQLPEPLRSMPLNELMALTPQQLTDKLKPAEEPKPSSGEPKA